MIVGKIPVIVPVSTVKSLSHTKDWAYVRADALIITSEGKIFLDLNSPVFKDEPSYDDFIKIKKKQSLEIMINITLFTDEGGYFIATNDPIIIQEIKDFPEDFLEMKGEIVTMEAMQKVHKQD